MLIINIIITIYCLWGCTTHIIYAYLFHKNILLQSHKEWGALIKDARHRSKGDDPLIQTVTNVSDLPNIIVERCIKPKSQHHYRRSRWKWDDRFETCIPIRKEYVQTTISISFETSRNVWSEYVQTTISLKHAFLFELNMYRRPFQFHLKHSFLF